MKQWVDDIEKVYDEVPYNIKVFELLIKDLNEDMIIDIAKRILISLGDPENIKFMCELDEINLKDYVIDHVIPDKDNKKIIYPRKSTWGEIIAAEILKDIRGHFIPIYRLRHKNKRNSAMQGGADVVTCVGSEKDFYISLSEVKAKGDLKSRGVYDYRIEVEKAYNHLKDTNIDEPEIIDHMIKILRFERKFELAKIFRGYFKNFKKSNKEFHIFMIMEKSRWGEDILRLFKNETIELPNLSINIFLINNLNQLINRTYETIPEIAEEVVYNE